MLSRKIAQIIDETEEDPFSDHPNPDTIYGKKPKKNATVAYCQLHRKKKCRIIKKQVSGRKK